MPGDEGPADQTARDRSGKTRLSGLGAALPQRDEAPSLVHVDLYSFYVSVLWRLKNHALFVRIYFEYLPRRFACSPSAALSSVRYLLQVRGWCVQIYVFPVQLSKLADSPVEATSEKLKFKSHFRAKLRCSRIMVDDQRNVCRRAQLATDRARRVCSVSTRLPFGRGYVTFSQKKAIKHTYCYEKKLSHEQVKIRSNPTAHEERCSYTYLVIFRCRRG